MAIEVSEARQVIIKNTELLGRQRVPLDDALNLVIAENVKAEIDVPPFPRSPLDGYALKSVDLEEATPFNPAKLEVVGTSDCGLPFSGKVMSGQCLRIFTGAPIPAGVDVVMAQEEVKLENGLVQFFQAAKPGTNLVPAGEDIERGELVIKQGTLLKPAHLGVLASLGKADVEVYRQPVIAVISTGQELVEPGTKRPEAKIFDCNSTMISALIRSCGGIPAFKKPVIDKVDLLAQALREVLRDSDAVVTTGGVSVGDKDLMAQAIKMIGGEILFWRIKMKPGTPMLTAKFKKKLIFCLSGNPGAAHVTFDLFVRPAIDVMCGNESWQRPSIKAVLTHEMSSNNGQNRFIRAQCIYSLADGSYQVTAAEREKPGVISASAASNALIYRPAGQAKLNAGTLISIELTDLPQVITSTAALVSTFEFGKQKKSVQRFLPKKVASRVAAKAK